MSRFLLFLLLLGLNRMVIGQNFLSQKQPFLTKEYDSISKLPFKVQESLNHIFNSSYSNYKAFILPNEIIPFDSGQDFKMLKSKYLQKANNKRFYIEYYLLIPGKGKNNLSPIYSFNIIIASDGRLLKPIELPSNEFVPDKILSYKEALRKTRCKWNNPIRTKHGFLIFNKELNSFSWTFTSKIRQIHNENTTDFSKKWLCQTIDIDAFTGKLTRNIKHKEIELYGME